MTVATGEVVPLPPPVVTPGTGACLWEAFDGDAPDLGYTDGPVPTQWFTSTNDPGGVAAAATTVAGAGRLACGAGKFVSMDADLLDDSGPTYALGVPLQIDIEARYEAASDGFLFVEAGPAFLEIHPAADEYDFADGSTIATAIDWTQPFHVVLRYEETPGAGPFGSTLGRTFVKVWQGTDPGTWDAQYDQQDDWRDLYVEVDGQAGAVAVLVEGIAVGQGDPLKFICAEATLGPEAIVEERNFGFGLSNPSGVKLAWSFMWDWDFGSATGSFLSPPSSSVGASDMLDTRYQNYFGNPDPPGNAGRRGFITYNRPDDSDPNVIAILGVRILGSITYWTGSGDGAGDFALANDVAVERGAWGSSAPTGPDETGTTLFSATILENYRAQAPAPTEDAPIVDVDYGPLGPGEYVQLSSHLTAPAFTTPTAIQIALDASVPSDHPAYPLNGGVIYTVLVLTGRLAVLVGGGGEEAEEPVPPTWIEGSAS